MAFPSMTVGAVTFRRQDWKSADELIASSTEEDENLERDCTRPRLNWAFNQDRSSPLASFLASCSSTPSSQAFSNCTPSLDSSSSIDGTPSSTSFSPFLTLASFSPREVPHDLCDESSGSALWPSFEYGGEACCPFSSPFELHMKQLPDDDTQITSPRERFISPRLLQTPYRSFSSSSIGLSEPSFTTPSSPPSPAPAVHVSPPLVLEIADVASEPRVDRVSPNITTVSPSRPIRSLPRSKPSSAASSPVAKPVEIAASVVSSAPRSKRERSLSLSSNGDDDSASPAKKSCNSLPKSTIESDAVLAHQLTRCRPSRSCRNAIKSYALEEEKDSDSGDDEYADSDEDVDDVPARHTPATTYTKGRKVSRRSTGSSKGNKLYYCRVPDCGKSFTRQHDVRRHSRLIHEGNRLQCPYCSTSWLSRTDGLRRHILSAHPRVQPNARENAIQRAVESAKTKKP